MADTNGVSRQTLDDKIETLRAEQRAEHTKTRAWVAAVCVCTSGAAKAVALLAGLNIPHIPFL